MMHRAADIGHFKAYTPLVLGRFMLQPTGEHLRFYAACSAALSDLLLAATVLAAEQAA
jgi:hypothetical protein